MPLSDDELRTRLQLGEDSRWEFKQFEFRDSRPISPQRDDLADEIAAFANAQGGTLLCGVTDSGDIQPMSRAQLDQVELRIVEICRDSIEPPLVPDVHRRQLDAHALLVVEIPPGTSAHEVKGRSSVRVGSSRRLMTSDERLRLSERRAQARHMWFDEQPVPQSGFASLDPALWRLLLSGRGLTDPERALRQMGLLSEDNQGVLRASVAGVLLCSQTPQDWLPQARITATRYSGTSQAAAQYDTREIEGPLRSQIAEAVAFVRRHNRVAAQKTPARVDTPEYSAKAVFEAVVNAVVHRDYSLAGSAIRLMIFDDRLEVISPGSLPNGLTPDGLASRQVTRNQTIASTLQRIEATSIDGAGDRQFLIERRGDGVPIILSETRATSGKEAEYRLIDETDLVLTLPAASLDRTQAIAVVTVYGDAQPLASVDVLALFPNKTWKRATTDGNGEVELELYATHLPMTVYAAAAGRAAGRIEGWIPADGALALDLEAAVDGGSTIFAEATGHIPRLRGRLNPILDTHGRTYIYADNVAVNQGQQQPVHFALGEPLDMVDSDGNRLEVVVVDIVGRSALLQYRQLPLA
ncbi:MAG: putative DNA binding domain-containing protein [Acidimicrobiaceae bacterium]|nr:putative DNA binding domain-containing protein [Acidimicrobiaceae bacterium]MDE0498007.1 putative DNA binding domain-containing protein [Acidimicrobiaceae bacterium]